jgi:quercetin dioxygenase-like cupin family protein
MLTAENIKWGECSPVLPPGAKCAVLEGDPKTPDRLFAYRIRMPDNFQVPPHFHPADEHVLVLSGTFNMGHGDTLDKKNSHAMTAGSFVVIPKGQHHYAWTKGETVCQVYAIGPWGLTYVNPKDDPRNRNDKK